MSKVINQKYMSFEEVVIESENEEEQKSSDFLIEADIIILKSELFLEHLGKSTYSELLDSRNNLAEHLNISKRRKQ